VRLQGSQCSIFTTEADTEEGVCRGAREKRKGKEELEDGGPAFMRV
jgi:hypothetical protein